MSSPKFNVMGVSLAIMCYSLHPSKFLHKKANNYNESYNTRGTCQILGALTDSVMIIGGLMLLIALTDKNH